MRVRAALEDRHKVEPSQICKTWPGRWPKRVRALGRSEETQKSGAQLPVNIAVNGNRHLSVSGWTSKSDDPSRFQLEMVAMRPSFRETEWH